MDIAASRAAIYVARDDPSPHLHRHGEPRDRAGLARVILRAKRATAHRLEPVVHAFNVIGNVYYVGTEGLSAFLVTGPQGHVLIDGGLPESAPLIAANIRRLGFRLGDVKYLLINHTHYDHAGGLAELKRLTGAKLVATEGEKADLEAGRSIGRPDLAGFAAVRVDRVIRQGERLTLGPIVLTAYLTPGHTRGGISWTTETSGKRVLFATSLTVAGQGLVADRSYPTAADDFRATFRLLKPMKVDVFLNFHPEFFDMQAKRARQIGGKADAFVDSGELARQVDKAERDFNVERAAQELKVPAPARKGAS